MNILVIGSGGREHRCVGRSNNPQGQTALFAHLAMAASPGIAECVDIKVDDVELLLQFALRKQIDLTIVGPEASLVVGIVDAIRSKRIKDLWAF